jgi:hypothetical protein
MRGNKKRLFFFKVIVIGDANGAILAYDALRLNQNFDDTTSLYGEGNLLDLVFARMSI